MLVRATITSMIFIGFTPIANIGFYELVTEPFIQG